MTAVMTRSYPTIAEAGRSSEEEFCRLTGGTVTDNRRTRGDVLVNQHPVEVKRVGYPRGTVHQVRVWQYLPLAIHDVTADEWLIVPPNQVVRIAAKTRHRGEHTENPFESAGLHLPDCEPWRVPKDMVYTAVCAAIAEGERYPELRALMRQVIQDTRRLTELHRSESLRLLGDGC